MAERWWHQTARRAQRSRVREGNTVSVAGAPALVVAAAAAAGESLKLVPHARPQEGPARLVFPFTHARPLGSPNLLGPPPLRHPIHSTKIEVLGCLSCCQPTSFSNKYFFGAPPPPLPPPPPCNKYYLGALAAAAGGITPASPHTLDHFEAVRDP